ncbi:MAG: GtrA family protein [Candidatus Andersenbacteria bacterium]
MIKTLAIKYRTIFRQFIKFGITGTVGAVVDFSTYNFLTRLLDWQTIYTILGAKIIAANLVSVFLAISSNFILNKYWTFRDRSQNVAQQGASYFTLNFITFVLNQLLTSYFVFQAPLLNVFGSQKDNAAKALAIGIILFINFLGSKFFIFRRKSTPPAPAITI